MPADYDGDGDDDLAVWRDQQAERAVFRPSSGAWFVEGQPVRFLGAASDHALAMPPAVRMLLFS